MKKILKYIIVAIIIVLVSFIIISAWVTDFVLTVKKYGNGNFLFGLIKAPFALFGAVQILRAFGKLIGDDLENFSSKWAFPIYFAATILGVAALFFL